MSASLAVAFSRWGEITTAQNEQRKRIIAELAEANAKLEAAAAENAELQARLLTQARARPCSPASRPSPRRRRMAEEPIRLLIVDDHPVVRDGLCGMFTGDPRFEVVGEAGRHPAGAVPGRRGRAVAAAYERGLLTPGGGLG